jgi:hypothetical protein
VQSKCSKGATAIVNDKDEAADGDCDASLPHLHSGASRPKSPPKLTVREHYRRKATAADAERSKSCEETAKHTKCAPKKLAPRKREIPVSRSLSSSSSSLSNNSSSVSEYSC